MWRELRPDPRLALPGTVSERNAAAVQTVATSLSDGVCDLTRGLKLSRLEALVEVAFFMRRHAVIALICRETLIGSGGGRRREEPSGAVECNPGTSQGSQLPTHAAE